MFYCRSELRTQLRLHQFGWHMVERHDDFDRTDWTPARSARRFECGSPNMLGIHALHASLSLLEEIGLDTVMTNVINNSLYIIDRLKLFNHIELLTPQQQGRYAGIVTFRSRKVESRRLYEYLMAQGVVCALRGGGVRFSPHYYTQPAQLEHAINLAASVT